MEHASEAPGRRFPRPTLVELVALAASVLLTLQYAWLLDDAFIYFRYVDNLVFLGRGLVFNQGEYVEGFSSPLWCLLLVPLRACGLDWWLVVRIVGVACAAGTWALAVALARRMSPRGTPLLNFPLIYLAFNYAVLTYFTSGVESPLVQLVAVAVALYVVAPESRVAQVLVGLAPMVRHELVLPFAIALAWSWWRRRRIDWLACGVCALTLGGWLVFRVAYYADFFPNTFYLKDEVNFARGWIYLDDTFGVYGLYWLVPLFAALALALRRAGVAVDAAARWVMVAAAVTVLLYVVKIGGDPRHYRYLAFPFCLLVCAAGGLIEHAHAHWLPRVRTANVRLAGAVIALGVFSLYPRQLSKHPFERDALHTKVGEINDAQYHRLKDDLGFSPWTLAPVLDTLDDAALDLIYGSSPLLPQGPVSIQDEYARWRASGETPDDYPLTTIGWCVTAWKVFTRSYVHKDGLTDPILARTSAQSWRAAHKKELFPLAWDLATLRQEFGSDAGCFERAIAAGQAPEWIVEHRESIDLIARKAFNQHHFLENLALAFRRVPRIDPGEVESERSP